MTMNTPVTYDEFESCEDESVFKRMTHSEFYFDVELDGAETLVYLVPKVYWDNRGYLFEHMNLDHLLPSHLENVCDSTWESERTLDQTVQELNNLGFIRKPICPQE